MLCDWPKPPTQQQRERSFGTSSLWSFISGEALRSGSVMREEGGEKRQRSEREKSMSERVCERERRSEERTRESCPTTRRMFSPIALHETLESPVLASLRATPPRRRQLRLRVFVFRVNSQNSVRVRGLTAPRDRGVILPRAFLSNLFFLSTRDGLIFEICPALSRFSALVFHRLWCAITRV